MLDVAGNPATSRDLAASSTLQGREADLSLLNHQVSGKLRLKDVDLDCLDLIVRRGPLSPSALARLAGLHPATMTGILDRLERGGWVTRDRDPADRRAVVVSAVRDRNAEVIRLYAHMNTSMDQICADYGETELEVLADSCAAPPPPDDMRPSTWPAAEACLNPGRFRQ
jgi:DNA-binding MarR family transcriptional regulator